MKEWVLRMAHIMELQNVLATAPTFFLLFEIVRDCCNNESKFKVDEERATTETSDFFRQDTGTLKNYQFNSSFPLSFLAFLSSSSFSLILLDLCDFCIQRKSFRSDDWKKGFFSLESCSLLFWRGWETFFLLFCSSTFSPSQLYSLEHLSIFINI